MLPLPPPPPRRRRCCHWPLPPARCQLPHTPTCCSCCPQVQHYHVTVTLLLSLADALATATTVEPAAAAAAAAPPEASHSDLQVLAAGAATLAGAILHRRLKALYFCLSSDMRGKANAALALLSATAVALGSGDGSGSGGSSSGGSLRALVRAFDWSLSALPGLARPPRCVVCMYLPPLGPRRWNLPLLYFLLGLIAN